MKNGAGLPVVNTNRRSKNLEVQSIRFSRWEISFDPKATSEVYAAVQLGGPEMCGCETCLNFAAARKQAYPSEVLDLFEKLGISADRETETYHLGRLARGRHLYGGWFHFVGTINSGTDAWKQVKENLWQPDFEIINEDFSFGFSSRLGLVRKPFEGLPVVQLEFNARVPWLLKSTEPT